MKAHLSALGTSLEAVRPTIGVLTPEERVRVAAALDYLASADPEVNSPRTRALYLALVSLIREQTLFRQVVSHSLGSILRVDED